MLLMIKWSLFFLFLGIMQVFAVDSYSQQTRLSLNFEKTKLETVLNEIENQTEFYFLYNQDKINVNQTVDVHVKDQKIEAILDQIFKSTGINYAIYDRQIVLTSQETPAPAVGRQPGTAVKGRVTTPDGEAIPGVTVMVKGTSTGTITDADGNYSLSSVTDNATLVFRSSGWFLRKFR
jgi:type II secretory pathway component GspD/PulD (secretin)